MTGTESLMGDRRWRVNVRYRRYSQFKIVAETNVSETFWLRRNASRRAKDLNHMPGCVATVERS